MSLADELLDGLSEDVAERKEEPHIVIGTDRFLVVPEELRKIGVQFDHNIETITFDCPRYWDKHDMSKMRIYINYIRADDEPGCDLATNIVIDEEYDDIMHFDWTITGHLTAVYGNITVLVCIQNASEDSTIEENHWNSELNTDMYISEGMECEGTVIDHYPGIITALLSRMDYVEEITTPEYMKSYVANYLDDNPQLPAIIKEHLYTYMAENFETSEEIVGEYVNMYMDKHPVMFAVGSTKPGVSCLWFNTHSTDEPVDTKVVKLVADDTNDALHAEIGETATYGSYDFTIR